MKKETLIEIVLGTIGGLVFAIGMSMCLIPEWNLFKVGIIVSIIGFIILLLIIPIYKKTHPKKNHKSINWKIVLAWLIGIIGALIMGFGMSKVMKDSPSSTDVMIGMITGILGLITCILDYPVYSYLNGGKEN